MRPLNFFFSKPYMINVIFFQYRVIICKYDTAFKQQRHWAEIVTFYSSPEKNKHFKENVAFSSAVR